MRFKIHTITLQSGNIDEWRAFFHIVEVMELECVIEVLERYDLEKWL